MKQFFLVPTTLLHDTPPPGTWHACEAPGDATVSLVVVEGWRSEAARDAWDGLPGTVELYLEAWGQPVPPRLVTAFAPWGVGSTDTVRQAMRKVRTAWPAAHP